MWPSSGAADVSASVASHIRDPFALHRDEHGQEGRLDLVKDFGLAALVELWLERAPTAAG